MSNTLQANTIDARSLAELLPKGPFTVHENGAVVGSDGALLFRVVYGDPVAIASAVLLVTGDKERDERVAEAREALGMEGA